MIHIESILSSDFNEQNYNFENSYIVMIDVLRASSVIITALQNGTKNIYPVKTIDEAWALKEANPNFLITGERNSIKIDGFDLGNSPYEYETSLVKNKNIIFTSTNGAKIFSVGTTANKRVIASFINYEIVLKDISSYIETENLNKRKINLFFISAGTYGKYSREDSLLAGKFINEISNLNINIELSDSSELIRSNFLQNEANLSDYLKSSKHAKYLRELSLSKDVEYCISNKNINVLPVIYPNNVIGL